MSEPPRLLGADALGVTIEWRYRYVRPGTRAESTPGVLYLDVGGSLAPGIIDHHGDDVRPTSTAELILQHRELVYVHLLGPVLERAMAGEELEGSKLALTLVTHYFPDFDGVTSTYFVRQLVETGGLPASASALAGFVTSVDQGRYRVDLERRESFFAPHIGHLALQSLPGKGSPHERSTEILQRGMSLVERALTDVGFARGPSAFAPEGEEHPATRWTEDPRFADAKELLDGEPERFADDFEAATREEVSLPVKGGLGAIDVPAFLSPAPPKSKLNKYWVRASGYPFFVCPYATDRDVDGRFGRVILSLDPTWGNARGLQPSLRGLGFALERAECRQRRVVEDGDERTPNPRWDDGTCDNADPWYDGRGHDFTIVDAPASTTHLPYDEVVEIATGGTFWHVPLTRGTLTMMWVADLDDRGDAATEMKGEWEPLQCPKGIDDRMAPFYEACRARPTQAHQLERDGKVLEGVRATREIRDFPPEARGGLELLHVEAGDGSTLQQLLEGMRAAVAKYGEPDYALSQVQLGDHNADPGALDALVRQLGDVEVDEMPLEEDELVLFNHRSLLVQGAKPKSGRVDEGYLEVLFYLAFVREALRDYRTRLAELLQTKKRSKKATERLRKDILAFQTRYFDLEIARGGRARQVSERLVTAMHLPRSYGEIQDQMRQLAQLEAREDSRQRERADLFMESALFFIAGAGVFETIVAFLTYDDFEASDWIWIGAILWLFLVVWALGLKMRTRRRNA